MILYILVGVEILKRKNALKAIASDCIPLDSSTSIDYNDTHNTNTARSSKADELPHSGQYADSSPINGSSAAYTISIQPSYSENAPVETTSNDHSALSFRQFCVLPFFFWVILMAIWIAPTTNRIAVYIRPGFESFPLMIAVGATGSLRGWWNGVVFITLGVKGRNRRKALERTQV
jgi:hypothetical protein